ncbi:hypothetical protein GCM10025771_33710 [Niveibacterium umoris]|uniref:Uncharacterized protein n=1 Tax=Niveibacterium umoris TaxID=1193620 RepID=A0A840BKM3_9RHOO|nr:hypothetical protein [Niveibacterium umoris]MBB4011436.1 hypothetical protein [Niveibacterium umoris]
MRADLPDVSFFALIYRYFWPFQYFRDASRGSRIEQVQNYRFNRTMSRYLPGFAVKWSCLAAACFGVGDFCEAALQVLLPAVVCYLSATGSMLVVVQVVLAWLWFLHYPERF